LLFGFINIVGILKITLLTPTFLAITKDVPKNASKLIAPSQEIVDPSAWYLAVIFSSFYVGIDIGLVMVFSVLKVQGK